MGCALALLGTHCAVYDESLLSTAAPVAEADAGAPGQQIAPHDVAPVSPLGSAAGGANAGTGASVAEGGGNGGKVAADAGAPGGDVIATGGVAGGGMIGIDGMAAASDAGGPSTYGGIGGYGGGGGYAGSAGGERWTDNNLSRGKPASADSQQTTKRHYASDANDGDRGTRWCAADWKVNHYWEVDLGKTYSLSSLRILWEKDAGYLFKVQSSVDRASWSVVLDKTESNSATANQQHSFMAGATGRYVRITVTGGLTSTIWASFYELDIFGH